MNGIRHFLSFTCGVVLTYFRMYRFAFAIVGGAVLLDIVTGVLASVSDGSGLSSVRAFKGVIKKSALFVTLGFGTFLDFFIPYAASTLNIQIPENMLFSTVICVYITVTECISITENIYRVGGNRLPAWISELLQSAKHEIDKGGNVKND